MNIVTEHRTAAQHLANVHLSIAGKGQNLALLALAGAERFSEWRHYPKNDARDPVSGRHFFYHAHSADERPALEHGHFHVFVPSVDGKGYCHLAGIALDASGMPLRIFTTNRWVTDEIWCDHSRQVEELDRFHLEMRGRLAPVAAWINAFVRSYKTEIAELLNQRDQVVTKLAVAQTLGEILEDRRFNILSERRISLLEHLADAGLSF